MRTRLDIAFTKYNQSSKFLTVHKRDDDYKKAPTAAAHAFSSLKRKIKKAKKPVYKFFFCENVRGTLWVQIAHSVQQPRNTSYHKFMREMELNG